jgi:hypothetical protein
MLFCNMTGWPPTNTLVAGMIHCTFTQGWGFPGGIVKAQPATRKVSAKVATGCPPTRTRVFVVMIEI